MTTSTVPADTPLPTVAGRLGDDSTALSLVAVELEWPVQHVLFDADGVLQDMPGGWESGAEPYLGERTMGFLYRLYAEELPTLAGQGEFLPLVAAALTDFGVTAPL